MLMARPSDRYSSAKVALSALSTLIEPDPLPPPRKQSPRKQSQQLQLSSQSQSLASATQPVSLSRLLSGAAFLGSEGGLLAIAALSLIGTSIVGGGVWIAMLAALVFLQLRRTIEGWDFLIILGLTLVAVILFNPLHKVGFVSGDVVTILVVAAMAAAFAVAIAVLFRLIYTFVSRFL